VTRREAEVARCEAEAARGQEAAAARQVGSCELRQPDGEEEVEAKLRGGVGGGATTGATRQPAGKQEANGTEQLRKLGNVLFLPRPF